MQRQTKRNLVAMIGVSSITALTLLMGACGKDYETVLAVTAEPAGATCQYGGLKIEYGLDSNENGRLDSNEIDPSQTSFSCAVLAEGKTAKINLTPIPAGADCTKGGTLIETGLDKNDNGKLDASEVDSSAKICNGNDGTNGTNGYNSLFRISDLPPGSVCMFGGTKIDVGSDKNLDGVLQDLEVTKTQYVCSVRVIDNVIVESSIILPGASGTTCVEGGVRLTAGVDLNGDKRLQPAEVTATSDICNKTKTIPGVPSLIKTFAATADQCKYGGFVFQTGLDSNSNGILEATEVQATNLLCNGIEGMRSLVKQTADTVFCGTRGGVKFESGLDLNRDNILDLSEVQSTSYVCNGYTGAAGKTSLIKQTADTFVCGSTGGIKIESGVDSDSNGILGSAEVAYTSYVCNGYDGALSLIKATADVTFCSMGGVKYESGLDLDGDNYLDTAEVKNTNYVCNGEDGWIVDVSEPAESYVCDTGGTKIKVGPDYDGSGKLSSTETKQTTYICNP